MQIIIFSRRERITLLTSKREEGITGDSNVKFPLEKLQTLPPWPLFRVCDDFGLSAKEHVLLQKFCPLWEGGVCASKVLVLRKGIQGWGWMPEPRLSVR